MTSDTPPDCYAILEISPEADNAAIRASYRRLAKLRHPDRNPENPDATTQFQLLQQSYSILVDPKKRRRYDRQRQKDVEPPFDADDVAARPAAAEPPVTPQQETSKTSAPKTQRVREGQPRREKGDAYRRSKEEQMRHAQAEAAAQRLRESGQRIREAAIRIREAAYRFRDERDRREREEAAKQTQNGVELDAMEEAERKLMEL